MSLEDIKRRRRLSRALSRQSLKELKLPLHHEPPPSVSSIPGSHDVKTTTTTTTTTTITTTSTTTSNSKADEGLEGLEFTIAADLTLYANPLRCLRKTARPASTQHYDSGSEMIATDLVKYGSPLDDNPN